jgi:type I restriction enzyme S subunit
MSAEYLDLCLQRYDFVPLTSGTTNRRKLTQPGLLNAEFMLAPLAEQARIVTRVTELRRLCATLRERLQAQQATQSRLAEALVEQALA